MTDDVFDERGYGEMILVDESLIILDIDLRSKEEVIEKIADTLDASRRLNDRLQFIHDVLEREEIISTCIGDQIVIPHARSGSVRTASLVYLRLKQSVDWNASEQAKYIFNIAVPDVNDENEHLVILSSVARRLLDETRRSIYFHSTSKKAIVSALLQ